MLCDFPQFDLKTYAVNGKSAIHWTHLRAFNFQHTWKSKVESEKQQERGFLSSICYWFVIDKINNIARYNLIDTARWRSDWLDSAVVPRCLETHEICCLTAELLFSFINNVHAADWLQIAVLVYHPSWCSVLCQT